MVKNKRPEDPSRESIGTQLQLKTGEFNSDHLIKEEAFD